MLRAELSVERTARTMHAKQAAISPEAAQPPASRRTRAATEHVLLATDMVRDMDCTCTPPYLLAPHEVHAQPSHEAHGARMKAHGDAAAMFIAKEWFHRLLPR